MKIAELVNIGLKYAKKLKNYELFLKLTILNTGS